MIPSLDKALLFHLIKLRWGIPDLSIWLQCMGRRSFYQYSPYSRRGYSGNSETTYCLNFNKKNECLYRNCKYLHRCCICEIGSHPAIKYPECFANSLSKVVSNGVRSRSLCPPTKSKHRKPLQLAPGNKSVMLGNVLMSICCLIGLILTLFHAFEASVGNDSVKIFSLVQ